MTSSAMRVVSLDEVCHEELDSGKPGEAPRIALDDVWPKMREEATAAVNGEPILSGYLSQMILYRQNFADALAHALAVSLSDAIVSHDRLREVIDAVYVDDHSIVCAGLADIRAVRERDPAAETYSETLLYLKG